MKEYDVIIIGAGLSGCVLGYLLRKQGKKILIIEKQKLKNKDKLCGGILTEKAHNLLNNIYHDVDKELNFKRYKEAHIINNKKRIKISDISIKTIYRKELDDFVLNKYLSLKGDMLDNSVYSNLNFNNKTIEVNGIKYKYAKLVGADGVFSKLREDILGEKQKMNFAIETTIKQKKHENLEVHFFDKQKSYGWVIPNSDNSLIGIGNVDGKTKIDPYFENYCKEININVENKRGAFLPTGNDIILNPSSDVYFIGDSAGLISPITGEGIYYALVSAQKLSENMNKSYVYEMAGIIKIIRKERLYKKYVYSYKIRNFIFNRHEKKLYKIIINRFAKIIL